MILKILLFPVMLLLMMYFIIALIVPTYDRISAEKLLITQKEATLNLANEKLTTVNAFVQTVDTHPTEKKFVTDFVPNDRREEILLSDLSQIAAASGVGLFSVDFSTGDRRGDTSANQGVSLIEGKIIANGTYEDFKKFSHALFRMKRLYAFENFSLEKAEKKKDEEATQENMLSGVVTFAYRYIPGQVHVDPLTFDQVADFAFVDKVMNTTTDTNPLVSQPTNRSNPFLP